MWNLLHQGLVAGINAARLANGARTSCIPCKKQQSEVWPDYITTTNAKNFQPMNANFGLFPDLGDKIKVKKNEMNNMLSAHWKQFRNF